MSGPWVTGLAVAVAIAGGYAVSRLVAMVRFRRAATTRGAGEPVTADRLIKRAEAAVSRLHDLTEKPRDPILRAQISDVDDHAAEVLTDLRRFADQVEALERSQREIPVGRLRHDVEEARRSRDAAGDDELKAELGRSVQALEEQLAVAGRLDTNRRTLLARIEGAVFDLEGLGVRITELIVMHDAAGTTGTEARLAELTGDLEGTRSGLTEARDLSEGILGTPPAAPSSAPPPPDPTTKQPGKKTKQPGKKTKEPGRARWDLVTVAVVAVIAVTCLANNYLPHGSGGGYQPVTQTVTECGMTFAFMAALTGDDAADGPGERDAADLAVAQDNLAHPDDCQVRMQQFDTATTGDAAESAASITGDASILAVVGPTYGVEATAAVPVFQESGLATISPSASDSALTTKGWTVFHRTLPSDDDQAAAGARYLRDTLEARHVFVVADDSEYGKDVAARVTTVLGAGMVAGHASAAEDTEDWSPVVEQIKRSKADAVYFGGWQNDAAAFVVKLRASLPAIPMMSGDRIITDPFRKAAGAAGHGTYATCPCVPVNQGLDVFRSQFKARFGETPGYYAPEAYDAAQIVLAGLRHGMTTRDEMLRFVDGWDADGLGRHIRFGPGGDLLAKNLNVWAYQSGSDGYFVAKTAIG